MNKTLASDDLLQRTGSVRQSGPRPLRVGVIGLRGIPDVQGGVESHVQNLYPLIVEQGCEVTVYTRRPFVPAGAPKEWKGIRIESMWSPKRSGVEALVHSVLATLRARMDGTDVLHIHGIGPAVVTPLARVLGMRTVVTHHSRNYEHEKWGGFARWLLKTGERFASRYAQKVICVSKGDTRRLNALHGAETAVRIPNGVPRMAEPDAPGVLNTLGLTSGRYVLNVARLVPEKRQLDLIEAFGRLAPAGWKLLLVGAGTNESDYPAQVRDAAARTPGVVLAGARCGGELATLYAHAGIFALPSGHEGMPITVLEATSFGIPCIMSDIPATRELDFPSRSYHGVGDIDVLVEVMSEAIRAREAEPALEPAALRQKLDRLPQEYRWESVAEQTHRQLAIAAGRGDGGSAARDEADDMLIESETSGRQTITMA